MARHPDARFLPKHQLVYAWVGVSSQTAKSLDDLASECMIWLCLPKAQ